MYLNSICTKEEIKLLLVHALYSSTNKPGQNWNEAAAVALCYLWL